MAPPDAPLPFQDGRSHLSLHLLRVGVCLERYQAVKARATRTAKPDGTEHNDGPDGSDGSDGRQGAPHLGAIETIDERLAAIDAELAERGALSDAQLLPLQQLQDRFELPDAVVQFLVAAAVPGLDLVLGRALCEIAGGALGPRQPDVGFLMDLLARDEAGYYTILSALAESSPLVRYRLVRLGAARGWVPEGPTLLAPVAVPERVVAWLRGETVFEGARFGRSARLHRGAGGARLTDEVKQNLARALFRDEDGRPLPLLLHGPALSGKAMAARVVAAERGLPTLEVDLESVAAWPQPVELLEDLLRESRLHGALLLLRHADVLLGDRHAELRRAVAAALDDGGVRVTLTMQGAPDALLRFAPGIRPLRFALPEAEEQLLLWERALPPAAGRAEDLDPGALVRRYRLTPGDILEAAGIATARAHQRGGTGAAAAVTSDDVISGIRQRLSHRLRDVAELVTTSMEWSDLVLPQDLLDRIGEIVASYDHERLVLEEWGFGGRFSYGRALTALFSGPPGTGKTMIAALIAKELGLELFRVDLSRVVSKWVGETEKNLGLAFDEAKNAQAILLFDEADSLFGKRTEVKSANDRYANLEVNFLLQRIEAFEGIVLLTSNKESAIDEAFRRRIRFRIAFPAPDEEERALLWRTMIPPAAPLAPGVSFETVARRFRMTGGNIKNAVMRAAYLAAATPEQQITQEILTRAATLEWEEMGKLTPA